MTKRNWKKVRPRSMRNAMELCVEYALEVNRRNIDRLAELMGMKSKWTLYRWVEDGRIPGIEIPAFEHACGIDFVTQYLAAAAHKVIIPIPSGSKVGEAGVAELQEACASATGLLSKLYRGAATPDETLDALDAMIRGAAWHRQNVAKQVSPELALFMEEEE